MKLQIRKMGDKWVIEQEVFTAKGASMWMEMERTHSLGAAKQLAKSLLATEGEGQVTVLP